MIVSPEKRSPAGSSGGAGNDAGALKNPIGRLSTHELPQQCASVVSRTLSSTASAPDRYLSRPRREGLNRLQLLVLTAVRSAGPYGLTAHAVAFRMRLDRASVQCRLSELRGKGLIADSGQRRRNASGRQAIVWIAVESIDA